MSQLAEGVAVWFPHPEHEWVLGSIKKLDGPKIVCIESESGKEVTHAATHVFEMNPPSLDGVENMAELVQLSEPTILENIYYRYKYDLIYTYVGGFLIAMNPYKSIDGIYSINMINHYRTGKVTDLAPHIFAFSNSAYRCMLQDSCSQSLVISGESGSGKTETTKICIQFMAEVCGTSGVGRLEEQILEANPILEAFGNSKTIRNDNSSRFGKFIQVQFSAKGLLVGAHTQTYLLEKTRLVTQAPMERNYHIFYQLVAGLDANLRSSLHITDCASYHYLNQSGCTTIDGLDDAVGFQMTSTAMRKVGLSKENTDSCFRLLAALLNLGNINFVPDKGDGCKIKDKTALKAVAQLMHLDVEALDRVFCVKRIKAGMEMIAANRNVDEATYARDSVAKLLYGRLFNWLVDCVNQSLSNSNHQVYFIGVLDIFGFERFENNSFEQLCINFANEKLQNFFNAHIFKLEQKLYEEENIDWSFITFVDNQPCIDLLERSSNPVGVFSILDEECVFPKATDSTFCEKITQAFFKKSPYFLKPPSKAKQGIDSFIIAHYAGEVCYSSTSFLDKNNDTFHPDYAALMQTSKDKLVLSLFKEETQPASPAAPGRPQAKKSSFVSVSKQFKEQLAALYKTLSSTAPHFIRCMKPNQRKLPNVVDNQSLCHQLHCAGVLEAIKVQQSGYPTRLPFQTFFTRYHLLAPSLHGTDFKMLSEALLVHVQTDPDAYRIGTTKVFFRKGQLADLEEQLTTVLSRAAFKIQMAARAKLARMKVQRRRAAFHFLGNLFKAAHPRLLFLLKRENVCLLQASFRRGEARRDWMVLRVLRRPMRRWVLSCLQKRRAARIIQRRYRSHRLRSKYQFKIKSIVFLQCVWRRHMACQLRKRLMSEKQRSDKLGVEVAKGSVKNRQAEMLQAAQAKTEAAPTKPRESVIAIQGTGRKAKKKFDPTKAIQEEDLVDLAMEDDEDEDSEDLEILSDEPIQGPNSKALQGILQMYEDFKVSCRELWLMLSGLASDLSNPPKLDDSASREPVQSNLMETVLSVMEILQRQAQSRAQDEHTPVTTFRCLSHLTKTRRVLLAVLTHLQKEFQRAQLDSTQEGPKSDVHALFGLPRTELHVNDFGCAYLVEIGSVKTYYFGRLYVTQNALGFHSENMAEKILIPLASVRVISKKNLGLIPSRIKIVTGDREHMFTTFTDRDQSFAVIQQLWKLVLPHTGKATPAAVDQERKLAAMTERTGTMLMLEKNSFVECYFSFDSSNSLCIYKDYNMFLQGTAMGKISLLGVSVLLKMPESVDPTQTKSNLPRILLSYSSDFSAQVTLVCETEIEARAWIASIRLYSHRAKVAKVRSVTDPKADGAESISRLIELINAQGEAVTSLQEVAGSLESDIHSFQSLAPTTSGTVSQRADLKTTQQTKVFEKSGLLMKSKQFSLLQTWEKRFVVLTDAFCYYFLTDQWTNTEPQAAIRVANLIVNQREEQKGLFGFEVYDTAQKRSLMVWASSANERAEWLTAFANVKRRHNERQISQVETSVTDASLLSRRVDSEVSTVLRRCPVKQGYLKKEGHGRLTNMRKRWIVLAKGVLFYFKDKNDAPFFPAGIYVMDDETQIIRNGKEVELKNAHYSVGLKTWAENEDKAKEWAAVLEETVVMLQPLAKYRLMALERTQGKSMPIIARSSVKHGTMQQRSAKMKTWANVFLVLKHGFLFIYLLNGSEMVSRHPDRCIPVENIALEEAEFRAKAQGAFEIRHPQMTEGMLFCASSPEEMRSWIETIQHELHDTEAQIKALAMRRDCERKTIYSQDKVAIEADERWRLIDAEWMATWKEFVSEDSSTQPPGPISNANLLGESGNPKPGLVASKDYRGVTPQVWEIFFEIYGGGPMLERSAIDIYENTSKVDRDTESNLSRQSMTKFEPPPAPEIGNELASIPEQSSRREVETVELVGDLGAGPAIDRTKIRNAARNQRRGSSMWLENDAMMAEFKST